MTTYHTAPETELEDSLTDWYDDHGQSVAQDIGLSTKRLSQRIPAQVVTTIGLQSFGRLFTREHVLERQLPFGHMLFNPDVGMLHLPLDNHSQDCLVLAHALDMSDSPHGLLREANRVLGHGAHMIIVGFNAFSLWGASRPVMAWRRQAPWSASFYPTWRVAEWLSVLGFETQSVQTLSHLPMVNTTWQKRLNAFDKIGRWVFPRLGNIYILHAKKLTVPVNPLRTRWAGSKGIVISPLSSGQSGGVAGVLNHESLLDETGPLDTDKKH